MHLRDKMIKKCLGLLILISNICNAAAVGEFPQLRLIQQNIEQSCKNNTVCRTVGESELPAPFNYLLTQPLMTLAIETFYQRTPIIQILYVKQQKEVYSRAILMLVDSDKQRNNAKEAQKNGEEIVVELAFITMNFSALPDSIKRDVLNTNHPFGKSLALHHVKIATEDRRYFAMKCNELLVSLLHCRLNTTLYGRTNTLVRVDDHQWLAHTIEIVTGLQSK